MASVPASGIGAGNESAFRREVVEAALAHVIGDKAEQAYRRSDALERRRKLMEAGPERPSAEGFCRLSTATPLPSLPK